MKVIKKLIHTILSISGFVPEHMTPMRSFFMGGSVLVAIFLLPRYKNVDFSIVYFICSTIAYIGFLFLVLPERGLRLKLIEKLGEERAYLYYEAFLAFAFFHNGVGLSFISQSTAGSGFLGSIPVTVTFAFFAIFLLQVWALKFGQLMW